MTRTTTVMTGDLLWEPAADARSTSNLGAFIDRLEARTERRFADYDAVWQWSTSHLEQFWASVWDDFAVPSSTPYTAVLAAREMPGARWFEGARLNYATLIFRRLAERGSGAALITRSQTTGSSEVSGDELLALIGSVQAGLRTRGVGVGDRVAGYLPNTVEAIACHLAVVGMGAIWCCVPPEMGPTSVLDRLGQLAPRVLFAVDGYRWGAREISRLDDLARISGALPDTTLVLVPYLSRLAPHVPYLSRLAPHVRHEAWEAFTAHRDTAQVVDVPFEHPLVVLFSSGTTGVPKAIVHCHGGLLIEHLKSLSLQMDLGDTDTVLWFTTTGWMVWNLQTSSLLVGARLVLVDGDPGWPRLDGEWSQWAIAAETGATFLATGAAYLAACARSGMRPGERWDLGRLREINSSGSPLAADVAAWVYDAVGSSILLAPTSGGTDVCSAFVGGSPLTPVYAGEMSCRPLGVAVEALDPDGRPLVGEAGELVVSLPMPSMPVGFWGDSDGERYRNAYFTEYPGRWRHGDWLIHTARDTWRITGRSDATLNRGGVRLGTAEFYGVLDAMDLVADSMVLHFEGDGDMGTLVLAIAAAPGADEKELERAARGAIRSELSPRHVPDVVVFVPGIPRNRTGKRLEIPVKRLVAGSAGAVDPSVLVDADALPVIVEAIRAAVAPARRPMTA